MTGTLAMVVGPVTSYYDKPINDRTIIKINLLQNFVSYINTAADLDLHQEDFTGLEKELYAFAGGARTNAELQIATAMLCAKVPNFAYYIVYCDTFGDKSLKGWLRYIYPLRRQLMDDLSIIRITLNSVKRSKFCEWVNDTLYYSLPLGTRVQLSVEAEYIE